jgi:hypothetical protein
MAKMVVALLNREGELHVGARQVLEDAGFKEVSRPTVRRVVMRIDFERKNGGDAG